MHYTAFFRLIQSGSDNPEECQSTVGGLYSRAVPDEHSVSSSFPGVNSSAAGRKSGIHLLIIAALLGLCATVYWPVRHFGFVEFDDPENIYREPHVLSGLSAQSLQWAMGPHFGHWIPLTRITYLLDQQWFNLDPGVMHAEDALVHLVNSVLLYALMFQLTRSPWRSAMVALLFAVHPMHVESVVWLTERRDVLGALPLVICLMAYVQYVQTQTRGRWWWYTAAVLMYALSLAARATGIPLPAGILLLDIWPLQRVKIGVTPARLLIEKIPFLLLAAAVSVPTMIAQQQVGAVASRLTDPISWRIANAIVVYPIYLLKLLIPTGLSAMYPMPPGCRPISQVLPALGLMMILLLITWRLRDRRPYLLVGFGWFLIILLPLTAGVRSLMQAMADRYTYLPSIGVFILLAWGGLDFLTLCLGKRLGSIAAVVAGGGMILSLAVLGRAQVNYWQTTRTLFEHANAVTDANWFAQYHIGLDEAEHGHYEQARQIFSQAISENPDFADLYIDEANAIYMRSPALSLPVYDQAIARAPGNARAYANRANARRAVGDLAGAEADARKAAQLGPQFSR
jgi:hypothetical protein